jgi:hypothetical protein
VCPACLSVAGRARARARAEPWKFLRCDARDELGQPLRLTPYQRRHTLPTSLERCGVASDATFRNLREDGAVRDGSPSTAGRRSRRQSETAGQDGCDRTVLRQIQACCIHSGCIRRKHDAETSTKKRSDEGRCHYRPVVTLTHSAELVIRSLPVAELVGSPRAFQVSIHGDCILLRACPALGRW